MITAEATLDGNVLILTVNGQSVGFSIKDALLLICKFGEASSLLIAGMDVANLDGKYNLVMGPIDIDLTPSEMLWINLTMANCLFGGLKPGVLNNASASDIFGPVIDGINSQALAEDAYAEAASMAGVSSFSEDERQSLKQMYLAFSETVARLKHI